MARRAIAAMLVLAGCVGVDASPLGTFGDGGPGLGDSATGDEPDGEDTGGGETGGGDAGDGSISAGESGGGEAEADTGGGAQDSGTTDATGGEGEGSTSGAPNDDDGTAGADGTVVQNHSGSCPSAMWCTDEMGVAYGSHGYAECFVDVGVAPPFEVVEVRYRIGGAQSPGAMTLQVRAWTGTDPGATLGTVALSAADASAGDHAIVLDDPIALDVASFCVSVEGDGFAVARDPSDPVPGVAFFQSSDCGPDAYATLQSVGFPGNLCMSATIASGG